MTDQPHTHSPEAVDPLAGGEQPGSLTLPAGVSWPVAICLGLLIVVVVNVAFIVIAVRGADTVVPSYVEQAR